MGFRTWMMDAGSMGFGCLRASGLGFGIFRASFGRFPQYGPQSRPQKAISLIIRTPKMIPLILGNPV